MDGSEPAAAAPTVTPAASVAATAAAVTPADAPSTPSVEEIAEKIRRAMPESDGVLDRRDSVENGLGEEPSMEKVTSSFTAGDCLPLHNCTFSPFDSIVPTDPSLARLDALIESPNLSPIKDDYPSQCKRPKVDMFVEDGLGVNEEQQERDGSEQRKARESTIPKPSCLPEHLLKPAANDGKGLVAIRFNISALSYTDIHSKMVTVRGVNWSLFCRPGKDDSLALFLKCDMEDMYFKCRATKIVFRLHHRSDSTLDFVRTIRSHDFDPNENDWGYNAFTTKDKMGEFADDDGTLFVSCEFDVDPPRSQRDDTRIPIGLRNQGTTCYMNSSLQILFHTTCLRKAILEVAFDDDKAVLKALQKLFYKMHTYPQVFNSRHENAVSTKNLTNSFGWNGTNDTFIQHDVQEMMKMLLDKIEIAFKGTKNEPMIDNLFKTKTRTFIRCTEVDCESARDDMCLDIQLPVRRQNGSDEPFDVISGLREMTNVEIMDGDNKYDATGYGLQRAERGTKFISFPKVLHIQLLRFQMDQTGQSVKVHDRVAFTDIVDLSEFVPEDGRNHEYALHGVVCHWGNVAGGHYVTYVCKHPGADKQSWFKLDDSTVTEVEKETVMSEEHFGNGGWSGDYSFNAYMLTYIRKDALKEVLEEFDISIAPPQLQEEMKKEEQLRMWKTIDSDKIGDWYRIRFATEPDYMSSLVWDHFDYIKWKKEKYRMRLKGYDPAIKIFQAAEEFTGNGDLRLFVMEERNGKGKTGDVWRITREVERDLIELQVACVESILGGAPGDYVIFIMKNREVSLSQIEECEESKNDGGRIIFLKYYDGKNHCVYYVTPMEVSRSIILSSLSERVCTAAGLPPSSHIKYWKEVWIDELEEMDELKSINVEMGDVFIFELVHLIRDDNKTVQSILHDAKMIQISLIPNKKQIYKGQIVEEDSVEIAPLTLSQTCTYRGLLEELSRSIGHSAEMIMLWTNGKSVESDRLDEAIKSALQLGLADDPRQNSKAVVKYARLSIPLNESEQYIGFDTLVTISGKNYSQREYLRRRPNLCHRFKCKIFRKYGVEITKLRFVWRWRQGSGYFVFREMKENENMIDILNNLPFAMNDSIVVCIDNIEDREMEMEEDEYIVPLVHIYRTQARSFCNKEPTQFIKIRDDEPIATLKEQIVAKCGGEAIDWMKMDLLAYMGAKACNFELSSRVDVKSLYEQLRDEPGLSESRDTRMFIALYHRDQGEGEEERVNNNSQSLVIRD